MNGAELLVQCLRAAGVQRTFGPSALLGANAGAHAADPNAPSGAPALRHVAVRDPALAGLLAEADGRIGPGPGAAWLPEQRLRLSARPDVAPLQLRVQDAQELPVVIASVAAEGLRAAVEVHVDLALDAPVSNDVAPVDVQVESPPAAVLTAELLEAGPVLVIGPGVLRAGHLEDLHFVARRLGLGVLNTFGAKGVFRWDDAAHHGTIGVQERDGELAGLSTASLVVLCGIDPDELPAAWLAGVPVLEVEPAQLLALAFRAPETEPAPPPRPELYEQLARVLGPRYESFDVPLAPARAAADLAAVLPEGGLVAADPGPAGLWVARALPTEAPGSVIVPATGTAGAGVALALVAALRGRDAIAVVTSPVAPRVAALCDVAEDLGLDLLVAAWGEAPALASAASHRDLLSVALQQGGVRMLDVPVALHETRLLVEVAGPVAAWAGPQN